MICCNYSIQPAKFVYTLYVHSFQTCPSSNPSAFKLFQHILSSTLTVYRFCIIGTPKTDTQTDTVEYSILSAVFQTISINKINNYASEFDTFEIMEI